MYTPYTHRKKVLTQSLFSLHPGKNATNTDWTHKAYVWSPKGQLNGERWRWKSRVLVFRSFRHFSRHTCTRIAHKF